MIIVYMHCETVGNDNYTFILRAFEVYIIKKYL